MRWLRAKPYEVHLTCCKDDTGRTFCGKDSSAMVAARTPDGPDDTSCLACLAGIYDVRCPNGGVCTG